MVRKSCDNKVKGVSADVSGNGNMLFQTSTFK